jgi:hypothetical protein
MLPVALPLPHHVLRVRLLEHFVQEPHSVPVHPGTTAFTRAVARLPLAAVKQPGAWKPAHHASRTPRSQLRRSPVAVASKRWGHQPTNWRAGRSLRSGLAVAGAPRGRHLGRCFARAVGSDGGTRAGAWGVGARVTIVRRPWRLSPIGVPSCENCVDPVGGHHTG